MITNERQYRITRSQLDTITKEIRDFNVEEMKQIVGSEILAQASLEALRSEEVNLRQQISEYEYLRSGAIIKLRASSLAELPEILIKARIAKNMTQRDLAEALGLKEQQIQRYEAEKYVRASLRRLIEVADTLDIELTEIAEINSLKVEDQDKPYTNIDWEKFPIKEMYKRGWFEGFSDSLDSALRTGKELARSFVENAVQKPVFAMHHKHIRSGSEMDLYALYAWEIRIITLSQRVGQLPNFNKEDITKQWIRELISLSNFADGPRQAQNKLREVGIPLIIEPHLPNTFLDGAVLLVNNRPIIGMTLRYDRLDNFWFVLLHEIMHLVHHLEEGKLEGIFDDLDNLENGEMELEADSLASDCLIPDINWQQSIVRFDYSKDAVIGFAEDLDISPAIVAGRIRHELNNYVILNEFIGQGQVRKQFDS